MPQLLLPIVFLVTFGVFNLFGIQSSLYVDQIIFFIIGCILFFITRKIGWLFFKQNARIFYNILVALLVVTLIIGIESRGAVRWINLYFFNFQVSEFFKVFFIIFLASYFSSELKKFTQRTAFLQSFFYFIIPAFLIFKQPDLGNSLVVCFVYMLLLFASNMPKKYPVALIVIFILFLPIFWFFLHDYQQERIASFLNPQLDTQGTAYNMAQAVITTGSGKLFGRGLGLGTQSRLAFLPENNTDFAYAALVEQFGLLGGLIVIFLYFLIIAYLIRKLMKYRSKRDEDEAFHYYFLIGLIGYLVFQFFINVGMNLGILPIAGIALPFISYGGSSLVSVMIALALIP